MIYYLVKKIGGKISKENFDKHEKEYADLPKRTDIKKVPDIKFYNSANSVKIIKEAQKMIYREVKK